jgi:hypothetical protein
LPLGPLRLIETRNREKEESGVDLIGGDDELIVESAARIDLAAVRYSQDSGESIEYGDVSDGELGLRGGSKTELYMTGFQTRFTRTVQSPRL